MSIQIAHPTNRPNFTRVTVGSLTLWFSYETIVGFHTPTLGTVASENVWGNTTGKHLNYFSDRSQRLPRADFLAALENVQTLRNF